MIALHHAEGLVFLVRRVGDEGHLAVVVDLREPGELGVRRLANRAEEAEVEVFRLEALEEAAVGGLVLGPDRAQHQRSAGAERRPSPRAHSGTAGWPGARSEFGRTDQNPRVQREHARLVGEQRIHVDLDHLAQIDDELRELDQRQADRLPIRRGPAPVALQQLGHASAAHQLAGEVHVERRKSDRRGRRSPRPPFPPARRAARARRRDPWRLPR